MPQAVAPGAGSFIVTKLMMMARCSGEDQKMLIRNCPSIASRFERRRRPTIGKYQMDSFQESDSQALIIMFLSSRHGLLFDQ
jgi:hypothetical protein